MWPCRTPPKLQHRQCPELLNSAGLSWHTVTQEPALHFPNSCSHQGGKCSSHACKLLSSPDADPWIQNSAREHDRLGTWETQVQQSLVVTLPCVFLNLSSRNARKGLIDWSGPQNRLVKPPSYFIAFSGSPEALISDKGRGWYQKMCEVFHEVQGNFYSLVLKPKYRSNLFLLL